MIEHQMVTRLQGLIRTVPDFPKPGIKFRDITPMLRDPGALSMAMELVAQPFRGLHIDAVAGAESRGFIFAMAVAAKLSAGFVPIRKPGRLPAPTKGTEYALEYGTDKLEIHSDALRPGDRVVLVDDLLATGGTMAACCRLVKELGAELMGIACLIELTSLRGRDLLKGHSVHSVIQYD